MSISQVSFGSRKNYNKDYDYAKYYNLGNNNVSTPTKNEVKTTITTDAFQLTTKKSNKSNAIKGVFAGFLAFLTGGLGLVVVTLNPNESTNKLENYKKRDIDTHYISEPLEETTTNVIYSSTKDFIISDTKQGKTADCWLLAVINSFKETEVGKEFFKNMFEYKDNETVVHLHVGDYTITDKELEDGRKSNSKGDDDVLLIELAVEKALADYNAGKVILPAAVITDELGGKGTSSTLNMGSQDAAIYILTGKSAEYLKIKKYGEKINNYFKLFQTEEKKNMSLTASIEKDDTTYTDKKTGKSQFLRGHHAYCIKDIKDGYVIVTNPENSKKEISIDVDSFKEIFSSVTVAYVDDIA